MNVAKIINEILWENIVSKFSGAQDAIQVGAYTYGNPKLAGGDPKNVIIGKFCSIAELVTIVGDNHFISRVANYPLAFWFSTLKCKVVAKQKKESPIVIGNDVWIGTGAIILPEVRIGDGAIIGAGAVVTHDVPPYAVVVGVPARILRYRFTQKQIEQLLKIAWWNWDCDKIAASITKFYGDVDDFIKAFGTSQIPVVV